jgi:osmotically-inducible protein OsmY
MSIESAQTVAVPERPGNSPIEDAILRLLGHSRHKPLRHVHVNVEHDRVMLSGTVPSFYLKQVAQETVRQTCPQCRVYNELVVEQGS